MQLADHPGDAGGLLEHILFRAPDLPLLHCPEILQPVRLAEELLQAAESAVHRRVVDQHIGIFRGSVEGLRLHVHSGTGATLPRQIRKDIPAAGQLHHLRDIVLRAPYIDIASGTEIEKGRSLSRIPFSSDCIGQPGLFPKKGFRLRFLSRQQPDKPDPLQTAQRVGLITGTVHQYRDPQPLQLLLCLRAVKDHRVFDGQGRAFFQKQLIIRGAVFPGKEDPLLLHGSSNLRDLPVVFPGRGETYCVQGIQFPEEIHHGRIRHIQVPERQLKHRDLFRISQLLRCLKILLRIFRRGSFRHHQEMFLSGCREKRTASRQPPHPELLRIGKRDLRDCSRWC